MRLPEHQHGLGWFGSVFMFALIAFAATVTVKCVPLYLNQMKISKVVHSVAEDTALSRGEPSEIRKGLQRRWDIEDIKTLEPADVKIMRTDRGRFLTYSYEARTRLFYNLSIVLEFSDEVSMAATGSR